MPPFWGHAHRPCLHAHEPCLHAHRPCLLLNPSQVNSDPYWDGWMIKVKLSNKGQLDELMDAAAYKSFCEGK